MESRVFSLVFFSIFVGWTWLVLFVFAFSPVFDSARQTPLIPRSVFTRISSFRKPSYCAHAFARPASSDPSGTFAFPRRRNFERRFLGASSEVRRQSFHRLTSTGLYASNPETESTQPHAGRVTEIFEQIQQLTLVEAAELVRLLEKAFGVSAVQTAAVAAAPGAVSASEEKEEEPPPPKKETQTVTLQSVPTANRIAVIKALRTIRSDLGLKEAKAFIDALPNIVIKDASPEAASKAAETLKAAGAELKVD